MQVTQTLLMCQNIVRPPLGHPIYGYSTGNGSKVDNLFLVHPVKWRRVNSIKSSNSFVIKGTIRQQRPDPRKVILESDAERFTTGSSDAISSQVSKVQKSNGKWPFDTCQPRLAVSPCHCQHNRLQQSFFTSGHCNLRVHSVRRQKMDGNDTYLKVFHSRIHEVGALFLDSTGDPHAVQGPSTFQVKENRFNIPSPVADVSTSAHVGADTKILEP